ncbi:MAG: phosphatidylglycerophosphatase A [Acholeplasmatales bacterium]|jgi:phosphatidylglycerophosphatase A|nr:phosphatidylglycerophosphatase A [Acholeplasmatales bacterium]
MNQKPKLIYTQEEMIKLNKETLLARGVKLEQIALIAYDQQSKYTKDIPFQLCLDSVEKIISYRDVFHYIQLGTEIDRLAEEHQFRGPIQDILDYDLGLFGADETFGLDIARNYGTIGQTNFGDIDVNKPGIVNELNEIGKLSGHCHTFLDDIVGAIAAAASTRVAQIINETIALENLDNVLKYDIFDLLKKSKATKK